ncbi:MAG: glutaredoxin family protein [Firmicutes bacterium]|nr:glutaredoxin family protein [Bacillota bacterium]
MYLREQGIDFEEKDVGVDEVARNDFISKGLRAVPSFAIGDEVVVGFNRAEIEKLLDL